MKAPSKIYVASYNGEAFSHSWTMEPLGDTTATEYIRKDALIEWAKEKLSSLKGLLDTDPYKEVYIGQCEVYKELIDKLNSI